MPAEPATPSLVELTRQVFDAADRGDFDAVISRFAPDAVWDSHVIDARFEGVAEIRAFFERWFAAYDAFDVRAEDILDLGSGVVVCVFMNESRPSEQEREPGLWFALVILWSGELVERVIGEEDLAAARATADRLVEERA